MRLLRRGNRFMAHAGFDTSGFPGTATMATIKSTTNFEWCGFYLGPAPSHPDTGWMAHRADLVAQGWGLAPLYVGQQTIGPGSHTVTKAQGTIDGNNAVALLRSANFPPNTFVYLDLENGTPFPSNQQDYVAAWVKAIEDDGTFKPGVYCSHAFADDVHNLVPSARLWVFKVPTTAHHPIPPPPFPSPKPSGAGFAGAQIWQLDQNGTATLAGTSLVIDLDSALTADPGI
jgi:hypothetical protein